jgi:integrase
MQVRDLTEEVFLKLKETIRKEKGERTANVMLTLFKRLFNLARGSWKLIEKNPCEFIKKFKENPRTERLSDDQITKLRESIDQELNPYVQSFFHLLLLTACRTGELQNMKWCDVNLATGEWKKPITKIGEPHIIPLGQTGLSILNSLQRQEDNSYVFCGKIQGKPLNGLRRFWLRICGHAGIEGVHGHDLRRTVGFLLLKNGQSMERVSQVLGHKSIRTTERVYAGLDIEAKRESINLLENLIGGSTHDDP